MFRAITAKLRSAFDAEAYVALPACDARIVQAPAASRVTVLPLTAHTCAVSEAKLTSNPDDAEALMPNGGVPIVLSSSAPKLIIWLASVTPKL